MRDFKVNDKCNSCGKRWVDHLGIMGTCKELQKLRHKLREFIKIFDNGSNIEDAGEELYRNIVKLLNK